MASRTETRENILLIPAGIKTLRAPECTDRAETSTNVSGWALRVGVCRVLPDCARRKRKIV